MRIRKHKQPSNPDGRGPSVVIDAASGPSTQPPVDRAALRDLAWQQGSADAARGIYDKHGFLAQAPMQYLRVLRAFIASRLREADREQRDDEKLSDIFIRNAKATVARTKELYDLALDGLRRAKAQREYHEKILRGEGDSDTRGWKDAARINESRLTTRVLTFGVPLVGLVIETPWSYFALEVLAETTVATIAMAVIFGWAGVLLAHLAGVEAKNAKAEGQRRRFSLVLACTACLGMVAMFLAMIRTAALAAPVVTPDGQSLPSGVSLFHLNRTAVFLGWLAVNVGLWLAVAILAYQHRNPHVIAYQRAQAKEIEASHSRTEASHMATDAREALSNALSFKDTCLQEWSDHKDSLREFGTELEEVYVHALVFGVANPEFTTAVEIHRQVQANAKDDQRSALHLIGQPEDKSA
jgi:hypothetical protein